MAYDPNIHHRRSIRMKGYDYSQAGLYFITICVQNRDCLFGEIVDDQMMLNDSGEMVKRWYYELENKYPDKRCHEMIIMPNHFHCIIENVEIQNVVGNGEVVNNGDECERPNNDDQQPEKYGMHNKKYGVTIGDAINWFKTMTTNEYIRNVKTNDWPRFNQKLWQRNYWEHIIRDEKSYDTISEYIINNPQNWETDKLK